MDAKYPIFLVTMIHQSLKHQDPIIPRYHIQADAWDSLRV